MQAPAFDRNATTRRRPSAAKKKTRPPAGRCRRPRGNAVLLRARGAALGAWWL